MRNLYDVKTEFIKSYQTAAEMQMGIFKMKSVMMETLILDLTAAKLTVLKDLDGVVFDQLLNMVLFLNVLINVLMEVLTLLLNNVMMEMS